MRNFRVCEVCDQEHLRWVSCPVYLELNHCVLFAAKEGADALKFLVRAE